MNGYNGFVCVSEFAYQLNVYCKNIFHRNLWNERAQYSDSFQHWVYHQFRKHQQDKKFDILEHEDLCHFELSGTLEEYFSRFVYNQDYVFISHEEVCELFEELVANQIWYGQIGDLYQIYHGLDDDVEVDDPKLLCHDGLISKTDEARIRSVIAILRPVFRRLKSKFNFFPADVNHDRFDGFWNFIQLGGRVWLVPLFLVFYNPGPS